jgi:N-acetylglucosamine kinase-like BadF-type ATPase
MNLYAGIDGGGTRTRLALVNEDGLLQGFAEGGCCSFVELGPEQARQSLRDLWRAAWQSAGLPPQPVSGLFIGTGSILSQEDERINCEIALSLNFAARDKIKAGNDALNALVGGLEGRPGILLISGTGSACLGRNESGETWRAGGWGHLLNDVGSAHALGLGAIIAATRQADGRGRATMLTNLVSEALALRDLKEIYRKLHSAEISRRDIAGLARLVLATANAGDPVAKQLEKQAIEGLIEMVVTVSKRLELAARELALTGGLISNAEGFRRSFLDRLSNMLPGLRVANGGLTPVFGAVLLAYEIGRGNAPASSFLENLRRASKDAGREL